MNCKEKHNQLKSIIQEKLTPLIDKDYLYLDLPYHFNLGDTLIWEGTLEFLKNIPYTCHMSTSMGGRNFLELANRYPEANILLNGGGNFGDIWTAHNDFRKEVIAALPNHKVIILPQTIFYEQEKHLNEDAAFYSQYPNVTICVRDTKSFEILKNYFPSNPRILLPDMAFCIDASSYKGRQHESKNSVFIKRMDKELLLTEKYSLIPSNIRISDWPTMMENVFWEYKILQKINQYSRVVDRCLKTNIRPTIIDYYWQYVLKDFHLSKAVNFISEYSTIYTTRMHAIILSIILNKHKIIAFDNSYGKNFSFIDTWLSDVDNLELIK